MVLIKKTLTIFLYLLINVPFYAIENNYWQEIFQVSFVNNPRVAQLKKDYLSQIIYKKQNDYLWYPNIQFDLNQSIEELKGDYVYIRNQYPSEDNIWLFSPNSSLSINQKLPGNGVLSITAGYGFNYLVDRNVFLQNPRIQCSLNQNLGYGAFGLTKNPERQLLKKQVEYSRLYFTKELISQLKETFDLIKSFDLLCADQSYYSSMVTKYYAEVITATEKKNNGLQSNLETYYANHQYSNYKNQLNQIENQKTDLLNQIKLLIPSFNFFELENNRLILGQIISDLFNTKYILNTEENFESQLYKNILSQQQLNYKINEINYTPLFYITSTLYPDSNHYNYYADWYKSFRNLIESPFPINFTTTAGLKIIFETHKAKKLRKELFSLERDASVKEYANNLSRQKKESQLLNEELNILQNYFESIQEEIKIENQFREDRKLLYEQKMITQNDYYESETLFFLIYRDYINTFWKIITNQLKIIELNSNTNILLITFLGDNYETLF